MNHALPAIAVLLPILTLAVGLVTGVGVVPAVVSGCATAVNFVMDWWVRSAYRGTRLLPVSTSLIVLAIYAVLLAAWAYSLAWAAGVAL